MKVRTAHPDDLDAIESLWLEMMRFHSDLDDYFVTIPEAETVHRKYMKSILEGDSSQVLVVDDGGKIMGYLVMKVCDNPPIYPHKKYVQISALSVGERHRRKGVGCQLVKAAFKRSHDQGITRVECSVAVKNPVSRAFWKKLGFRATVERCFLDLDGSSK
jgi:ribosomal protein S18 acetylase RimI-like enzyme